MKLPTHSYRHTDEAANQIKFSGGANENRIQFLKQIEWNMELIRDNLGDADKINVVSKQPKGTAAE